MKGILRKNKTKIAINVGDEDFKDAEYSQSGRRRIA